LLAAAVNLPVTEQLFSKVAHLTTFTPGAALPDGSAGAIEWLERNGLAESGVVPSFGEIAGASASKLRMVAMRNESGARSCLERPLTSANQRLEFMSTEQFKLSHYPWFERSVVPAEEDRFLEFTKLPTMQRRLQAAGVRYLLNFDGDTQNTSSNAWYNGGSCFAGCVGLYSGTRHSSFTVAIYDLWQGKKIFDANATKSGDCALIWLLLPIPLFPATESQACNQLAGRIAAAFEDLQKGQTK
jgi:hypothetical protein